MLRIDGENPQVSEMFYRAVVQEVLTFGAETWVLSAEMSQNLERLHVGFLIKMTGQKEKLQRDGNWRIETEAKVLKAEGTQKLGCTLTSGRQQWRSGCRWGK